MFCPYCGASGLGSDGICPACGQHAPVSSAELDLVPADEETGDSCPNCGSPLGADEIFCGQCGTRVSLEPEDEDQETSLASAWVNAPPKVPSRRLSVEPRPQRPGWDDTAADDYDAPTESFRRASYPRVSSRVASSGSPSHQIGAQRATAGPRKTAQLPASPPRSQTALLISLLCFFASFVSGVAAVWLAVAR